MPLAALCTPRGSAPLGLHGKLQLRRRFGKDTAKCPHSCTFARTSLSHICRASESDEDSAPLTVESIQKKNNKELLPRPELPRQRQAEANGLLFSSIVQNPWESMYGLVFIFVVVCCCCCCCLQLVCARLSFFFFFFFFFSLFRTTGIASR